MEKFKTHPSEKHKMQIRVQSGIAFSVLKTVYPPTYAFISYIWTEILVG